MFLHFSLNILNIFCINVYRSLPDNGRADSEKTLTERLFELRNVMKNNAYVEEPIQAYIIPSVDSHQVQDKKNPTKPARLISSECLKISQSEYISIRDQRMAYVSGFTGSAGTVIVTDVEAVLWTDSRYWIQAESELDADHWTLMRSGEYF